MSDLSPETKALLARVSAGDAPTAADRDRVLSMLGPALATQVVSTSTAAGTAGTVATGGAVKVVLAFVVAVGVGGAGVTAATSAWRAAKAREAVVAVQAALPVARPAAEPSPVEPPVVEPQAVEPSPVEPPAVERSPVRRSPRLQPEALPVPGATPDVAPAHPPSAVTRRDDACDLSAELAVLQQAQQALKTHPAQAAAGLEAFSARCPTGALLEERLATRALALCANGNPDEGRATAQELSAQFPASPSLARVTQACGR